MVQSLYLDTKNLIDKEVWNSRNGRNKSASEKLVQITTRFPCAYELYCKTVTLHANGSLPNESEYYTHYLCK